MTKVRGPWIALGQRFTNQLVALFDALFEAENGDRVSCVRC